MFFRTFSPVVGSLQCDGRCPFCVAAMTPSFGLTHKKPDINWEAFDEACRLAKEGECSTVLLTGNGEPTLFPDHVTAYLERMQPWAFSNIELQTNGMQIGRGRRISREMLARWHELGLQTIAISVTHWDPEMNKQIYVGDYRSSYINLPELVSLLKEVGFTVRLTCIMFSRGIDSVDKVQEMIRHAHDWGADQLTLTPMNKPEVNRNDSVYTWSDEHQLAPALVAAMVDYVRGHGELVKALAHGASIYDFDGIRICLSNCLTKDDPQSDNLRNLIYFPTGYITTNWEGESDRGVLRRPGDECISVNSFNV